MKDGEAKRVLPNNLVFSEPTTALTLCPFSQVFICLGRVKVSIMTELKQLRFAFLLSEEGSSLAQTQGRLVLGTFAQICLSAISAKGL